MTVYLLHSGQKEALQLAEKLSFGHGSQLPADQACHAVIQWGAFHKDMPGVEVLQTAKAILRAQHAGKRDALLGLHGIKTISSHGDGVADRSFPYKYKVAIFHLETLAVYEKKEGLWKAKPEGGAGVPTYKEVEPEFVTYRARRAIREAQKAIYALGLDYGIVTIGVIPSGHTLVLGVDAVPKLEGKLLERFAEAMNRYAVQMEKELFRADPVMLGADPEFLLQNPRGKVVSASRFLERAGLVGCDAIVLSGHRVILPLAELRPLPSHSPRELTANLHRMMQLASRKIGDESLVWLSGGMPLKGFPLGGHIHFSGCWLSNRLLRALDNYLALPLLLIEGESSRSRRPRYGFLGDYRRQPHGGFEYRTPPSWLVSPRIACSVLSLSLLIVTHYRKLRANPLEHPDIQAFYYAGEKEKLRGVVDRLWTDLETLGDDYKRYANYLQPLRDMLNHKQIWNEKDDIRRAWKIAPYNRKEAIPAQFML